MKHYSEDQYKDWQPDEFYVAFPDEKYLKKGDERVRIILDEKNIQVEKSNIKSPYKYVYVYFLKTKSLGIYQEYLYNMPINTYQEYDEIGKLIKIIDNNKPYKISKDDLITILQQRLSINLLDVSKKIDVSRSEKPMPHYIIMISQNPSRVLRWIKIDGTTGKIISDKIKTPPNKYIIKK